MRRLLGAGALLMLLIAPGQAATLPGPLVDVAWLAENLESVSIIDVRKDVSTFETEGHIPGAAVVDWGQVRADRTIDDVDLQKMLPERADFEKLMLAAGVSNDSVIVIAHQGNTPIDAALAARVYWQLKYFGHDAMAVLNGGLAAWEKAGQPLSTSTSPPPPGTFSATAERTEILAKTEDVTAAIDDETVQLADNRPLSFYLGLDKRDYVYAKGHIPTAINVPFALNTAMKSPATFRPADQLRPAYSALRAALDGPVIVYCNSGEVSAQSWFVLYEILGNRQAKLYDGSMHEWTRDESRPVVAMRVD